MESRVKLLGHPVHPMLIVYPLGLFSTAAVFDVIHWITGKPGLAIAAFWMIAAGIVGALAAAVFGLIDWLAIPDGTRARRVGLWHGVGNVVVVLMFVGSLVLRILAPTHMLPPRSAMILSILGAALGGLTAWLGGELVNRLGVGVDDGANLNAPSSLSGRSAASVR